MRTTINVDEALLELAKQRARARRVSLGKVVEDALRAALVAAPPQAAPPFEVITFRGEGPREGIDLDKTNALLVADDEERYGHKR